jgi:hypothetical protein
MADGRGCFFAIPGRGARFSRPCAQMFRCAAAIIARRARQKPAKAAFSRLIDASPADPSPAFLTTCHGRSPDFPEDCLRPALSALRRSRDDLLIAAPAWVLIAATPLGSGLGL